MNEIPCYYYEGSSLAEKYAWMRSGPGGTASIDFGDGLGTLAIKFNESDSRIGQNLIQRKLGAEWQGQAATAASAALNQAATVVAANAVPGNTGRDSSHQYGDSFDTTKNAIQLTPEPGRNSFLGDLADGTRDALNNTFGSTFGVQSDYSRRLAAYQVADQAANDALYRHENTSRTVLTAYQGAVTGQTAAPKADKPNPGTPGQHGPGGAAPGSSPGPGTPGGGAPGTPAGAGPGAKGGGPGAGGPGASGAGKHGESPAGPTPVPTTAPAGFTPLVPARGGSPSLAPGPTGGYLPTTNPGFDPGAIPSPSPALPPLGGGYVPHTGYAGGYSGGRPLAPRGGGGLPSEAGGRAPGGGFPESVSGARPGGPGGLGGMPPMGAMGGAAGARGQEREHRNNMFLPDDEPFRVADDDVTPSVIGLPDEY